MNEQRTRAEIRDIQYLCYEISQWTSIYEAIPCDNKVIKELGYERLESLYTRLKESLGE